MISVKIDPKLCAATKNKNDHHTQCPKPKKGSSEYCGVHIRAKKVTKYKQPLTVEIEIDKIKLTTEDTDAKPSKAKKRKIEVPRKQKEFFTLQEMSKIPLARISMQKLKKSVMKLQLNHLIDLYQTKDKILNSIKELHFLMETALENLDKIIKLQAFFRMHLIHNRYKCVNPEDFLTFEELPDIPAPHFFCYKNPETDKYYGFNVQSFHQLVVKSKEPQNPYTRNNIPAQEIDRINKIVAFMKTRKYDQAEEMLELSEEQQYNAKVIDTFSKIDALGNYTDTAWFTNLNMDKLKDLYTKAEDIWAYRLQMPLLTKQRIVSDGIVFTVHPSIVKSFEPTEKRKLQHMLLTEFDRLVSEGQTEDDKKIGAMIILTAFTEVVPSAAQAMPHYVQDWA